VNIFELFGKMSIDGLDKTNQELSGLEKNVEKVQKGMKIAGAAFTAFGAAGLAIIQSTKKINADLGVTALTLGVTTKEMRDLTLATTNVTFPISEVTASFDLLARAGIKDTEVLAATATAFDTLGDATGRSASQVTEVMIPAMKTFRLSAEEIASKTDKMTYMVRNSTISLEDFNTMVGYTDQEMVEAGFTIDDMAAAMMYMSDQGVEPGKVMLREWNKAVTRSKEESISMTEALGMTSDELEVYKGKLDSATGLTQEYADEANKQYTIMDKLKQKWSEITLKASGFLEPLEPVLAGMTAMGPLMMALSTGAAKGAITWGLHTAALVAHKIAMIASAIAIKAVTIAQWLWNAALTANPIGIIIMAIVALIAAGVALWKNWDKVVAFFGAAWDKMKAVMSAAKDFFVNIWNKIVGVFKEHWDKILAVLFPAVGLPILIARNWDKIVDFVKDIWNRVIDWFKGIPKKIGDIFAKVKDFILTPFRAAWSGIEKGINWLIRMLNKISFKVPDWVPFIGGKEFGINIPEVSLPKFDRGGLIPEPTMLYGLRSQRPYALAGLAGVETVTPGVGGQTITNEFNIAQLVVREEADVPRIARELLRMQESKVRATGG